MSTETWLNRSNAQLVWECVSAQTWRSFQKYNLGKSSYTRLPSRWMPALTTCFGTDIVVILTSWLASFTFPVISLKWTFPNRPSVWLVYDSAEPLLNILDAVCSVVKQRFHLLGNEYTRHKLGTGFTLIVMTDFLWFRDQFQVEVCIAYISSTH